jgi:hypothetical protein
MATPHVATMGTFAADTEYLVRRGMTKGYEYASLLAPPAYIAFILARRGRAHLSVNNMLRTTCLFIGLDAPLMLHLILLLKGLLALQEWSPVVLPSMPGQCLRLNVTFRSGG